MVLGLCWRFAPLPEEESISLMQPQALSNSYKIGKDELDVESVKKVKSCQKGMKTPVCVSKGKGNGHRYFLLEKNSFRVHHWITL